MSYWKSLIILKEIKNPNGKLVRISAKNQLRLKIHAKFLKLSSENLNGKLIFYPFSVRSVGTFVSLYSSGK